MRQGCRAGSNMTEQRARSNATEPTSVTGERTSVADDSASLTEGPASVTDDPALMTGRPRQSASHLNERLVHPALYAVTLTWGVMVVLGLGALWLYATSPGNSGEIAPLWPRTSSQRWDESRPTLLVFAHPKCPCTRATIDELAWIMTRCNDQVTCRIYFMQPESESEEWGKTSTWHAASAIPGVEVYFDPENQEATAFGAETSGHAMLFDTGGRLMFQGGITPSRGHRGDNVGCNQIVALVRDGNMSQAVVIRDESLQAIPGTDVFGCPLSNESSGLIEMTTASESRES